MSTSLQSHALNIVAYLHRNIEYGGRVVVYTVTQDHATARSPRCVWGEVRQVKVGLIDEDRGFIKQFA